MYLDLNGKGDYARTPGKCNRKRTRRSSVPLTGCPNQKMAGEGGERARERARESARETARNTGKKRKRGEETSNENAAAPSAM